MAIHLSAAPGRAAGTMPGDEQVGRAVSRIVGAVAQARSIDELITVYLDEVRHLVPSQLVGVDLYRGAGLAPTSRALGVSDGFLERYDEVGRSADPVLAAVLGSAEPQLSSELMPLDSWLESDLYRDVLAPHRLRSSMQAPILSGGRIIGTLSFADGDPAFFSRPDLRPLAGALGAVLGLAVMSVVQQDSLRRQRDQLAAALDVTVLEEVGAPDVVEFDHSALSRREREIAAFVSHGMQNQQIADHLVISVHTVKQHLKSIHRKLGVTTRVELARAVLLGGTQPAMAVAGDVGGR